MGMPYQCLKRCGKFLVAARGSSIDTFNEEGSLLSTLNRLSAEDLKIASPVAERTPASLETQESEFTIDFVPESSPPAKRRKLSNASEGGSAPTSTKENGTKKEQNGAKKGNKRSEAVVSGLEMPAVILLAATEDGRHVIAVTGEDKSIRVFENTVDGDRKQFLKQLSQRTMPKRPCAIALTPDNSMIISADKFGDVYSLPLLVPKVTELPPVKSTTPNPEPTSVKSFVPAANNLTVHSQRNRKALENQKKQGNRPTEKPEPTFEYKLLLGHVSMLTDLALVSLEGRNYILTADRDEHIRVSRGIPQAHIIEGFCLGHTEFISRLCIPKDRADVLISGGGDDELYVWDWVKGVLISKADLRNLVVRAVFDIAGEGAVNGSAEPLKLAVSGITHIRQVGSEGPEDLIVVRCDGVPAIFTFLLTAQNELQHLQTLKVPGNVLDIAAMASGRVVLSIDFIHQSGSTTKRRGDAAEEVNPLYAFALQGQDLVSSSVTFEVNLADNKMKDTERLTNLFYNLESLRKRDGDGREEE